MSDCCTGPAEKPALERSSDRCPSCGTKGVKVDPITLKALLTGEGLRRGVPPSPRFCATVSCPVVYFDNAAPVSFDESVLIVRVSAKHPEDLRLPVCYCFSVTPETIRAEVEATGRSTASADIAREVKAGRCACEVKNPKGSCCLGDVSRVENAVARGVAMVR